MVNKDAVVAAGCRAAGLSREGSPKFKGIEETRFGGAARTS